MNAIPPLTRTAQRILSALLLAAFLCTLLALPAGAISSDYRENKALWDRYIREGAAEQARSDSLLLPQPPYPTDNPANRGSYSGPCPIGGTAPQLRSTGLLTGALCRGACGMDCPVDRCTPVPYYAAVRISGGQCTYPDVVACISHQGCRDHDACYDYCTDYRHETSILTGHCHGLCNQRCYDKYGYANCVLWAALPGSATSMAGFWQDYAAPPLTDRSLYFSDEPVFTPDETSMAPTGQPCDSTNPYDCWTGTFSPK